MDSRGAVKKELWAVSDDPYLAAARAEANDLAKSGVVAIKAEVVCTAAKSKGAVPRIVIDEDLASNSASMSTKPGRTRPKVEVKEDVKKPKVEGKEDVKPEANDRNLNVSSWPPFP
jgi:hypothetical protein